MVAVIFSSALVSNEIFLFFLHRWGGPLSQNWLDQQLVLQKQIISRMLELGMTPGIHASQNMLFLFFMIFLSCGTNTRIYILFVNFNKASRFREGKMVLQCKILSYVFLNLMLWFDIEFFNSSITVLLWKCSGCFDEDISFCKNNKTW